MVMNVMRRCWTPMSPTTMDLRAASLPSTMIMSVMDVMEV